MALCVLVTHCHNLYGKRVDVIYQEKSYLTFCTFLWWTFFCLSLSTTLKRNSAHVSGWWWGGVLEAGRAGTQDPKRDGKKCNSALYLLLYSFIVLNEMFPLVYFLVGYVENNFRKYCCNSYVGGSCVTKKWNPLFNSEAILCESIILESENDFTRRLGLETHLVWKHRRLCQPPHFT